MNANWTEIPKNHVGINRQFPPRPGCYAIYLDGRLVYVGSTQSLRDRLTTYRIREGYGGGYLTPWGQFDSVRIKVRRSVRFGDWAMYELRMIRRLKPPLNCLGLGRNKPLAVA